MPLDETETDADADDDHSTGITLKVLGVKTGFNCVELPAWIKRVSGWNVMDFNITSGSPFTHALSIKVRTANMRRRLFTVIIRGIGLNIIIYF